MKLFLTFLLSLFAFNMVMAQGGAPGEKLGVASSGDITGKVIVGNNEPLPYASIYLIKSSDSSQVMGAITSENGQFIIERLKFDSYLLRISSLGYLERWFKVSLSQEKPSYKLGTVKLEENGNNLKEIQIEAERKLLESSIDKKTFQVDKSIISQSGSAVDAIEQIPNVTIDENGNLQLRGSSNVLILINGKPIGMNGVSLQTILAQIPANTIDKIEIMTNPSSKYDAEGANGIINIILKQNKNKGVNGNISAQVGTRDKYNLGAGLSFNYKKMAVSMTYGLRRELRWWDGYLHRQIFSGDQTSYFNTDNNGTFFRQSHAFSLNADYFLNKFNTLSFTGSGSFGISDMPEWIRYNERDSTNTATSKFVRYNDIHSQNKFYTIGLQHRKTFANSKKTLDLSANYAYNNDTNTLNGRTVYDFLNYLPYDSIAQIRQNRNLEFNQNALVQGDLTIPMSMERKLEIGLKSTFRSFDNEMRISASDAPNEIYYLDSGLSNRFYYAEIINAGYFNFSGIYKKVGYQLGTRVEQTLADGELKYTKEDVGYKRLDFFPSFYLVKKVKKAHELKLNYTRRIERPSSGELNPFSDLSDPRNIRQGNPNLKPEFINSYELEYSFTNKKIMTNPGLYYKQTNNLIWRYITLEEGINYVTFENIGNSYNIGIDWVTTWQPFNWVNTLTSINVFRNRQKGKIGDFEFDQSNIMGNVKQMVNFKVKKGADIQFTYNYRTPFLSPQGKGITMHWMDMGASYQVLKGKGTFTLTVSDIFNTRQFGMDLVLPNVEQSFLRKRESQILYVGFNYRFGKSTGTNKPKRKEGVQPQGEDGGGGF